MLVDNCHKTGFFKGWGIYSKTNAIERPFDAAGFQSLNEVIMFKFLKYSKNVFKNSTSCFSLNWPKILMG